MSLAGYYPWGYKESDTSEPTWMHMTFNDILENPAFFYLT